MRKVILNTKELIDEAISLPIEERAIIIDFLLMSLNPSESDIDQKWAAIAKKRLAEIRSRKIKATPGNEVFNNIWNRFNK